jgi:two-component system cell cycle response regulator DivK
MMRVLLEMEGYQVIEAADGLQAVEMALNYRPSMIMMDLTLPRLDGLSATHLIHEQLGNIPIVALSGHMSDAHRSAAFAAGCIDYLVKPLDFELLYKVLARLSC